MPSPTILKKCDDEVTEKMMPNPEYEEWMVRDMQVLGWIRILIPYELIRGGLKQSYMIQTESQILQLRRNLVSMKQGDRSITEFCNAIKSACDQLSMIGENVPK